MDDYRLRYRDRSRKFIRADVIEAISDSEAVAMAGRWGLQVRSELWKDGRLVAKFARNGSLNKI